MEKEYRSVRVGGMSESSYGTATMECFKREKLGNYTVLFVGPWTPDKLRAIGEFCRKENMRFVMDEMMNRLTGEFTPSYLPLRREVLEVLEEYRDVLDGSLLMCEYGPENLKITTIENYEKRIPIARENFRKAGRESQIEFLTGDAGEILKELTGTYDLIFMDAAKGQYINWLPDVLQLMHKGSVLVSDNVLQEGDIIESHYLVERRNRTIYKRMRQYLYELKHNPLLETSILPLGDGASISVKKEELYA